MRSRRALALVAAGGLGGAACDQIHVRSAILRYRDPALLGQAWWVAPQFGLAVVAMVTLAGPLAEAVPPAGPAEVTGDALWFLAAYGASGAVGNSHPVALAATFVTLWALRLWRRPRPLPVAVVSVVLAAAGVLYEGSVAATGAFHYVHPDVYHVPLWLAGLYLQGAPLLVSVAPYAAGR